MYPSSRDCAKMSHGQLLSSRFVPFLPAYQSLIMEHGILANPKHNFPPKLGPTKSLLMCNI